MGTFDGRIALITGSSRGIGAAIARHFAVLGATVAVHGRDAAAVDEVCTAIDRDGGRALPVTADVTDFASVEAARTHIEEAAGPIDILVANAGGSPIRPSLLEEIDEEGWRASIDANLTSTYFSIKSVLPGMKERRSGSIITMSSAAARRPHPGSPIAYAVAKAGIEMLTKDVAMQAGPFGVRANCLAPETIVTERTGVQIPADVQERLRAEHPLRRLGTPEDVARAAAFLASDDASWITGVVVDIAGGNVMP
jgi:3-oxoacyl-[acyl-carrier protein] reductase